MKEKIKKVNIYLLLVLSMILPINISAYSDYIIASGKSVGLEIKNNGVIVADFYSVNNISPGLNAGLKKGDIIRNIDNKNIVSSNDFINVIKNDKDNVLNITYYRNNKKYNTSLKLVKDNNIKFDLIFLDPPYKTDYAYKAARLMLERGLLKESSMLILETDIEQIVENQFKNLALEEFDNKKYGRAHLLFYKLKNSDSFIQ